MDWDDPDAPPPEPPTRAEMLAAFDAARRGPEDDDIIYWDGEVNEYNDMVWKRVTVQDQIRNILEGMYEASE